MSFDVRFLTPADEAAWNAFVHQHPLGSPFHLTHWRDCIQATFGYEPRCLLAEAGGRIRGVLPLFLVRTPLAGRILLSSPFAVYGGMLADSDDSAGALRRRLESLAQEERVQYAELRNAWPEQGSGYHPVRRYVTFTKELQGTEEELLQSIPRKTRASIRKSLQCGLASRRTRSLDDFLRLYLANLRRLGTPAFPRAHFERLLERYGDSCFILEILSGDVVVAAVLTFLFRDQILPYYGASDPRYHALQPNNFMYWDLMRAGLREGFRLFDFGRSKIEKSGSFDFKSHWGMTMRELPYEVLLVRRRQPPDLSPNNPRFELFIQTWRRLPLWLTNRLGPALVKWVP
ncbi:MAG: peptidoglycan bridge formation protein FemAB [Bryobacteraceae bacterium]|nr:MAG: peptidoglycan bridge formation protein FemAB [Bryobacteraceae bacterium]